MLAGNSLSDDTLSFASVDLYTDPYILAVPPGFAPMAPREGTAVDVLRRTIRFDYDSLHNRRLDDLLEQFAPRHTTVAVGRTFESALAMVEAGRGVTIVPQLATEHCG